MESQLDSNNEQLESIDVALTPALIDAVENDDHAIIHDLAKQLGRKTVAFLSQQYDTGAVGKALATTLLHMSTNIGMTLTMHELHLQLQKAHQEDLLDSEFFRHFIAEAQDQGLSNFDENVLIDLITKNYQANLNINGELTLGQELLLAARFHDLKNDNGLLDYYIAHGVNINVKDEKSNTALMLVSKIGFVDSVKLLTKQSADIHSTNDQGASAFLLAAGNARATRCFDQLMEGCADIHHQDQSGKNALFYIGKTNPVAAFDWLIEHGVNMYHQDHKNNNVFNHAVSTQNVLLIEHLLKEKRFDVNQCDTEGNTPIMSLANSLEDIKMNIDFNVIRVLIDNGLDLDIQNKEGKTFLDILTDKKQMKTLDSTTRHFERSALTRMMDLDDQSISPVM